MSLITMWEIAGFVIGWIFIELACVFVKVRAPLTWNFAMGAVGVLIAYTIMFKG